ncbi:hypothetical protein D3Z50_10950 [Clostridiaceae bacterium]|nr:hypothetical protein [Clostridiaceae bacterium]
MSQVIAGIYELQRKIGSGGGGIVYLGRHLRLDKPIVLKADKRALQTKEEALRREVDMLKSLSHMYIPQVYDFVCENHTVYTVMDYIEGESLDKLLERREIPAQSEAIRWACQLLEALCYLHSRPPHGILHGDIKPANIMLRPGGDICLIDYNIALALGENGAVKAGRSRGYASPEHYGVEFADGRPIDTAGLSDMSAAVPEPDRGNMPEEMPGRNTLQALAAAERLEASGGFETTEGLEASGGFETTEGLEDFGRFGAAKATEGSGITAAAGRSSGKKESTGSSGRHTVMLDVRSDLYSLGATLYHLISGVRPAQNALRVEPLGPEICSPAVSAIIAKAMAADPARRYQSAQEMLDAFRGLYRQDIRAIRHKRRARLFSAVMAAAFLSGGACALTGSKQLEHRQRALALAEYSADALAKGDVAGAVELALSALPAGGNIFEAPPAAQAQKALTDALGVYDLSGGFKSFETYALLSAPFGIEVSPDGGYFAVLSAGEAAVFETETGERKALLSMGRSALSDLRFVDGERIVYAGENGVTAFDLHANKELWSGGPATSLSVSGDKRLVAAADRTAGRVTVYRMSDGSIWMERELAAHPMSTGVNDMFTNPGDHIFALNEDGSLLAASFADGSLFLCGLDDPDRDRVILEEETTEYRQLSGGFCGKYFAFVSNQADRSQFGLVDAEEGLYIGGYEETDPFALKTDADGIYLSSGNLLVSFDPETFEETELAYTGSGTLTGFSVGDGYVLAATGDQGYSFYDDAARLMSSGTFDETPDFVGLAGRYAVIGSRNAPFVRILRLEDHREAHVASYDARYEHDEARVSQDRKTLTLFSYREFMVCDLEGNELARVALPDPEAIYDQQFEKSGDGSWLEVTWYDGMVRRYSAADGSLLSEEKEEAPRADLYEEFFTDQYRVTSPLHGTPEVYDRETGRLLRKLEEESYLTYVTQAGEYLITEYVTSSGERYGLLLDGTLETLACLPGLCDIDVERGLLVFDDEAGNLRQCRLYSLRELEALGETYIKQKKRGKGEGNV